MSNNDRFEIPLTEATTVIRPHDGNLMKDLRELVRHQAIFFNLLRRDWQRQYVELKLGWLWVFARPLLMTMIFFLLKRGSNANVAIDIPYPVFLYVGLVVWFTWVETVGSVASSGRINAALMSKVYFPRLYSPMSQAAGTALRTLIGLVPMVILMAWFGVLPGWEIAYVPALLLHSAVLAFAVGTIFGILAIDSSDWNSFRGLVLYVGLFLTPVIYPIDMVPEGYRLVFMLNPAVGVVDGFRGAMVDAHPFHYQAWLISTAVTGLLTIIAVVLFKRTEAHMLDEL